MVTLIAFAIGLPSCSSSFHPAESPRIAMVIEDGGMTLIRDGRSYPVGMFGTEVVDAVQGNPAAEAQARSFRNQMITGWSVYAGGLALSIGGIATWQANEASGDGDGAHLGEALTIAGIAALLTGGGFIMNAQPKLWDAVNLYNYGVDARLHYQAWPPRGYPPPYTLPPGSWSTPPASAPQRREQ